MARVLLGLACLLLAAMEVVEEEMMPDMIGKHPHVDVDYPSRNTTPVLGVSEPGIRPPNFEFSPSPPSQPWRAALLEWRAWPPEPPPPWEGVQWALSGDGPVRAVVVADAGDGERWLRWLHPLAHAPLLLWRSPARAPSWVLQQGGYVIAARELERLNELIINDTLPHGAILEKHNKRNLELNFRRVQFDSRSPLVLSLRGISSLDFSSMYETWDKYERVMEDLWECHKTFRGILFLQDASAKYIGIFRAPENDDLKWYIILEYFVVSVAARVMKIASLDLEGNFVPIFFPSRYYQNIFQFDDGRIVKSIEKEILDTLKDTLRFRFMKLHRFQKEDFEYVHQLPKHLYAKIAYSFQQKLVENGITPISTLKYRQIYSPNKSYECIQATSEKHKLLVIVPRAANLPGWSLPLRVFSPDIWGALATAAVVYALAWRVITGDGPLRCVSATLAALSSCGSEEQGRIRALPQRLQLAGALLASSVVIAASYQGRLYSLVAEPEKYPEIDTMEQLADSSMPVFSYSDHTGYSYFVESTKTDELSPAQLLARLRILERGISIATLEEMEMIITERRNVAFLLYTDSWRTSSSEILFGRKVHNLKESIIETGSCLIVTKNWPWRDVVEQIILLMKQSGIYQHVDEMNTFVRNQFSPDRARLTFDDNDTPTTRVLQLADLLPHLQLLLAGILVAVTCLAGEIWHRRRSAPSCSTSLLTQSVEGVPQDPNLESNLPSLLSSPATSMALGSVASSVPDVEAGKMTSSCE